MSAAIFEREVLPNIDVFDERNLLIFSVGPLCGTAVPYCGRHFVMAKSPLTNILGESSSEGYFGKELKSAGFDYIIFKEKSETPVSLWINDGKAEILDASDIWGLGIQDTDSKLKEFHGNDHIKVAAIGIAGENLVKFAC